MLFIVTGGNETGNVDGNDDDSIVDEDGADNDDNHRGGSDDDENVVGDGSDVDDDDNDVSDDDDEANHLELGDELNGIRCLSDLSRGLHYTIIIIIGTILVIVAVVIIFFIAKFQ